MNSHDDSCDSIPRVLRVMQSGDPGGIGWDGAVESDCFETCWQLCPVLDRRLVEKKDL